MKFGLKEATITQINEVLATYPQIQRAILYGSRAKGNYKPGSDIDLTLVGSKDLNLDVLMDVTEDIEELLLPYMCDISVHHRLNDASLQDHIQRVGQVFYER